MEQLRNSILHARRSTKRPFPSSEIWEIGHRRRCISTLKDFASLVASARDVAAADAEASLSSWLRRFDILATRRSPTSSRRLESNSCVRIERETATSRYIVPEHLGFNTQGMWVNIRLAERGPRLSSHSKHFCDCVPMKKGANGIFAEEEASLLHVRKTRARTRLNQHNSQSRITLLRGSMGLHTVQALGVKLLRI